MTRIRFNADGDTEVGCHKCGCVVGTVEGDNIDISDATTLYYCSADCKSKSLQHDILNDIDYKIFKHVVRAVENVPEAVHEGLRQARAGQFVKGPDLDADAKQFEDAD